MDAAIESIAIITGVIWITSLREHEEGVTRRIIEDLEPALDRHGVPFQTIPVHSADAFRSLMKEMVRLAESQNFKPIIHLDMHGDETKGLKIAQTGEHISWADLTDYFRAINFATGNNLCVVSLVCHGLHVVKEMDFEQIVPFYILVAPEGRIPAGFIENKAVAFYSSIFDGEDFLRSHEAHLHPETQLFHSERMVYRAITGYILDHCVGRGKKERLENLITQARQEGVVIKAEGLREVRFHFKKNMEPTQALLNSWASRLMGPKPVSFTMAEILERVAREISQR